MKEKVVFISLFGVENVAELKIKIITGCLSDSLGGPSTGESAKSAAAVISKILDGVAEKYLGTAVISDVVTNQVYNGIKETLFIFDDLERRGEGLKLVELLGVVTDLKERKNCSVLIITNEDVLSDNDRRELSNHSEKQVDQRIEFDSSPEAAGSLVFDGDTFEDACVRDAVIELGIVNIRNLNRIKTKIEQLLHHANDEHDDVKREIIRNVVLVTYCLYQTEPDAPTIEFLRAFNRQKYFMRSITGSADPFDRSDLPNSPEEKAEQDREIRWADQIGRYGYSGYDDLGKSIESYISQGWFDEPIFNKIIQNASKKAHNREIYDRYMDYWVNNWESLSVATPAFIDGLTSHCIEALDVLEIGNVDVSVRTLEELGAKSEKELILEQIKSKSLFDDIDPSHVDLHSVKDPDLIELVLKNWSKKEETPLIDHIFERILDGSQKQSDWLFLSTMTAEQLSEALLGRTKAGTLRIVKQLSKFKSIAESSEQREEMINRTTNMKRLSD